jgi:hypothetical protein
MNDPTTRRLDFAEHVRATEAAAANPTARTYAEFRAAQGLTPYVDPAVKEAEEREAWWRQEQERAAVYKAEQERREERAKVARVTIGATFDDSPPILDPRRVMLIESTYREEYAREVEIDITEPTRDCLHPAYRDIYDRLGGADRSDVADLVRVEESVILEDVASAVANDPPTLGDESAPKAKAARPPIDVSAKVIAFLGEQTEPISRNAVEQAKLGSAGVVRKELDALTAEGVVVETVGPRRARLVALADTEAVDGS